MLNPSITSAVIQARTGSIRLPNKVLLEMYVGRPMIWHIINRVEQAKRLDSIILTTTTKLQDQSLVDLAKEMGIKFFVGSENDVLDRYYQCATHYKIDTIVRITGDCPLIDPEIIDKTIDFYRENDFEYVSNCGSYPDGLDTEVFDYKLLEYVWKEAKNLYDREHVTSFIHNNQKLFRCGQLPNDMGIDFTGLHWSVDTKEDLKLIRQIYIKLKDNFRLKDIVELLNIN